MSIIRSPRPESNFYILDKRISEDARLSWSARGMLIFLLGKPDHWKVNIEALINCTGESCRPAGKTAVYAIITELLQTGYMQRQKHADGTLDYWVHEIPQSPVDKGGEPDSGNPNLENPNLGNPPLVSTEPKQVPKKAVRTKNAAAPLSLPEWLDPELWDRWVAYRRKRDRAQATSDSMTLWIRSMTEIHAGGHDLKAAVEASISNNWKGIFSPANKASGVSLKQSKSLDDMDYSQGFTF